MDDLDEVKKRMIRITYVMSPSILKIFVNVLLQL
jgi:hypothetical protein